MTFWTKSRVHKLEMAAFLTLVVGLSWWLVQYQRTSSPLGRASLGKFSTLTDSLQKNGVESYLRDKETLKEMILDKLKSGDDDEDESAVQATQIAVYLFPEILPDEDFEKQAGMELWAPLQRVIESNPRTRESRQAFEEMRANIWNYENPSRDVPQLSPVAMQVIRIYDVMSTR